MSQQQLQHRAYLALLMCLTGCANTTTRPDDDAFEPSPDVTVVQDAGVDAFAPSLDAFALDAPSLDAVMPDAFTPPDAFSPDAFTPPPDICNDIDDDSDGAVDEGGSVACSVAPNGERAVCESGVCLCRASGTPPVVGSHADCNASWADGCETELGTDANCAACGDVCDAASTCRATSGVYACGAVGILDFSIPEPNGEIACIVREDHRVVCRGLNSDFAISDTAPRDALLGWTLLPPQAVGAKEVRAWRRPSVDGTNHLSVCVLNDDNSVSCRGDNTTGLLTFSDLRPYRGWFLVRTRVASVIGWSTWGGSGLFEGRSSAGLIGLRVWGLPHAPLSERLFSFGGTNRVDGEVPMVADRLGYLYAWGPEVPGLTPPGWSDTPPTRIMSSRAGWVRDRPVRDLTCSRDVCCLAEGGVSVSVGGPLNVACWGRAPRTVGEVTAVTGFPDIRFSHHNRHVLELAPGTDGRIEGCLRIIPDDGSPTRFFCADVTTAADTLGPVSPEPFHEEPSRVFDGRTPRARPDWQAMCTQHRPDWWQCWGTHDGWGHE